MSTRYLIEVISNKELKISQYGQCDGYPSGAGATISEFIHSKMNTDTFKKALSRCVFLTSHELNDIDKRYSSNWKNYYPQLSRDVGDQILEYVQDSPAEKIELRNSSNFKNNEAFCEFYYLINMDDRTVTMNGQEPVRFIDWTMKYVSEMNIDQCGEMI